MSESTLSLDYDDIATEVGTFLGYTATAANWNAAEIAEISRIIQSGLRQFYNPPLQPNSVAPHEWTFLRPVTDVTVWPTITGTVSGSPSYVDPVSTITATEDKFYASMVGKGFVFDTSGTSYVIVGYASATVITVTGDASSETSDDTFTITSDSDYRMPDEFGGIDGPLTYPVSEAYGPIDVVGEGQIREKRQNNVYSAHPMQCAIVPLISDGVTGQRFDIRMWPDPNSIYVLTYRFNVLMGKLLTGEYPYGGMHHSETILESCLSIAEQRKDDEKGMHWNQFIDRLVASIAFDSTANEIEYFGYNSDRSDEIGRGYFGRYGHYGFRTTDFTYNGNAIV